MKKRMMFGSQSGMTMVEQLVVLGIVALALTAALAAVGTGARGLTTTASQNQALALAVSQMEHVKSQTFISSATTYATGPVVPAAYTLSTAVSAVPGASTSVQKVTVSIVRNGKTVMTLEDLKLDRP